MKRAVIFLVAIMALALAVSAQPAPCTIDVTENSVLEFIAGIPALNSDLAACPIELPSPASYAFSNDQVLFNIAMLDGDTDAFTVHTVESEVTQLSVGSNVQADYEIDTDECAVNTILQSGNMVGALAFVYQDGRAVISANGFFKRMKLGVLRPFLNSYFSRVKDTSTAYVC